MLRRSIPGLQTRSLSGLCDKTRTGGVVHGATEPTRAHAHGLLTRNLSGLLVDSRSIGEKQAY